MEWEADFFGLGELLKIIGDRKKAEKAEKAEEERKKREGPKMSPLECQEKAAEMLKKAAEARKMVAECPNDCNKKSHFGRCQGCDYALDSAGMYDDLAEEYKNKNKNGGG